MTTPITIVATTWLPPGEEDERRAAFTRAIESWERHLKYSGDIDLHIADDGTEMGRFDAMIESTAWSRGAVTYSRQERAGVGASLNIGIAMSVDSLILHAVDDWLLLADFDLDPWAAFLVDQQFNAGMVRFFPHPDLTGTVKHIPPHGWAVLLDRHHYVFATRPALFQPRFFQAYGPFLENVSAIEAEAEYNRRIIGRDGPDVWLALPEMWRPIDSLRSLSEVIP